MRFVTVALALLASSVAHAAAVPEAASKREAVTADTIVNDVYSISTNVYKLRRSLDEYAGGPLESTHIPRDFADLQAAHRQAWAHAGGRGHNFTVADSHHIVHYLRSSVGNDIPAAVNDLQRRSIELDDAGESDQVADLLKWLHYDYTSFSDALSAKLTGALVDKDEVVAKIQKAVQGGIAHFKK